MTDIIEHFKSKTVENANLQGMFSLSHRKIDKKEKHKKPPLGKRNYKDITYEAFRNINLLFNEYIKDLSKNTDPKALMDKLYKIELTGAQLYIRENACIVVEERKNSFVVVYENDIVKVLLKNSLVFYLEIGNIKYGFIAKNLKLNRFLKK
ncbi:hypothetical protein P3W45_000735 [Vairimorpha bombi]|jgi:hypothetical protein